ncbi:hypothetical protein AVEN_211350-1 [Araneus ventricosus]|uniref:Uncharacterized protein n=1 Tax=Araneus ventricosus TaxID=182803 RepID=A0A4Y2UF17_ARAVE|nr:hypothetical protein AVEN_211350-1 [Araneus ventricosus]
MSLFFHVSLKVGKRDLQRFLLVIGRGQANDPRPWRPFCQLGNKFGNFGDKLKVLENTRIIALFLLGTEILLEYSIWHHALSEIYKYQRSSRECMNPFIVLSAEPAGELSAIVGAVAVIISDLLSVCVTNLRKRWFSCFLCFVFSEYSCKQRDYPLSSLVDI